MSPEELDEARAKEAYREWCKEGGAKGCGQLKVAARAARLEGIRLGLEAAATYIRSWGSLSTDPDVLATLRALNPEAIAKETAP